MPLPASMYTCTAIPASVSTHKLRRRSQVCAPSYCSLFPAATFEAPGSPAGTLACPPSASREAVEHNMRLCKTAVQGLSWCVIHVSQQLVVQAACCVTSANSQVSRNDAGQHTFQLGLKVPMPL